MSIEFNIQPTNQSIIKVIGVGGAGGNAVNNMFQNGILGVDFLVCNTDHQVLDKSPIPNKIQLGQELTSGLGAGSNPEIGKQAAIDSSEEIKKILNSNTKMVFVTAGMGGGTGTGAAPIIAGIAKDMGILTVGIVTTPFNFEGSWRKEIAYLGLNELEKYVDTLLVIDNDNLLKTCPKNIAMRDAFHIADQVLSNAAKGIAEIITVSGYVNVDFADVQTIMKDSGTALMGMASKSGKDRAEQAILEALSSPLLDNVDIHGATGMLVNIACSPENRMSIEEYTLIGNIVNEATGGGARIILGNVDSADIGEQLIVTVIATGFERKKSYEVSPEKYKIAKSTNDPNKGITNQASNPSNSATTHPQPQVLTNSAIPTSAPEKKVKTEATPNVHVINTALEQKQTTHTNIIEKSEEPENQYILPVSPKIKQKQVNASIQISRSYISPEERLSRMGSMTLDSANQNLIKDYEDTPAYERRRQSIDYEFNYDSRNRISNLSINGNNSSHLIKDNNSYLYDNVD